MEQIPFHLSYHIILSHQTNSFQYMYIIICSYELWENVANFSTATYWLHYALFLSLSWKVLCLFLDAKKQIQTFASQTIATRLSSTIQSAFSVV